MAVIDYFYSLVSPYTYLAGDELEQIAVRHGVEINYRPTDFNAVFGQTGGLPVPKRHPSRQAYRLQELKRWSAFKGMAFNLHPKHWPTDPTLASLSVIAAKDLGAETGALSRAFLSACWAEDREIADPATVDDILSGQGLDPTAVANRREHAQSAYDANASLALELGAFGAPFYVVGEEKFWGQDRLDFVDRHLAALAGSAG
ncbi:MAG: 2-hydroxychromene-2-carboxylate isomerase [Pseudomonadota bacterium]